jgi:hypothetical protein
MGSVTIPQSPKMASPSTRGRKLILLASVGILVVIFAAAAFLTWRWPFRREAVLKDLEEATLSKIGVDGFRNTYFPRPGCVLEQVTFQHNPKPGSPPLITVQRLRIESGFFGLFTQHINLIRAEGLRLMVPPHGSGEHFQAPERSTFVIDEIVADGAMLEVGRRDPEKPPLRFSFHSFSLSNVGGHGPALYRAKFSNPEPPGEITSSGTFGPWNPDEVGMTAVTGDYLFQNADLGVFHGIAGELSSSGKFSGTLKRIEIQGVTDIPSFSVTSSSHQTRLQTQFHAVVNGENGDTVLQRVAATLHRTTVWSEGSVAGTQGQPGKTASFELWAQDGRIQDLLLLFGREERAPMSGTVSFRAKVSIPAGKRAFLAKVELQGDFGIDAGSFSKFDTQQAINHLSEGARSQEKSGAIEKGDDRDTHQDDGASVLSDLKGHVSLREGTARFSGLSFSVPGAHAQMHGTYNLITEKIDLHGTLKTESAPSNTTHGMKSAMLKVLEPFFKKKPSAYLVPVKITGTYQHPLFGLELSGRCESEDSKCPPKNTEGKVDKNPTGNPPFSGKGDSSH